jgi:hypothetical protein
LNSLVSISTGPVLKTCVVGGLLHLGFSLSSVRKSLSSFWIPPVPTIFVLIHCTTHLIFVEKRIPDSVSQEIEEFGNQQSG